jgi:hypothetical protein
MKRPKRQQERVMKNEKGGKEGDMTIKGGKGIIEKSSTRKIHGRVEFKAKICCPWLV